MVLRAIMVLLFLAVAVTAAAAQAVLPEQPLFGTEVETENYRILVIGDALGGGLGAGLTRMAELETGFEVTNRFKEESGVARPEVHDWGVALPKLLEGDAFDAVVVLLGSNDRQAIRIGERRFVFGMPEWVAAYKERTDRILDALLSAGVKVYWVGIPPMADPEYDAAMRRIAELQRERVEAKGAKFVDIRKFFLNPDGSYTDSGPGDEGVVRRLRSRDGVTFFKQGNNRLGQLVLAAIKEGMAEKAPPQGAEVAAVKGDGGPLPDVPLFGQAAADGAAVTFRPEHVEVADLPPEASETTPLAGPAARLAGLRALAVPGSAAEMLFSVGQMPPPPAGRADDFSFTPAP
ncbi:MAG: SGNH/GDSL hydrolase family protein [Hyphomicrobiales bacterium]